MVPILARISLTRVVGPLRVVGSRRLATRAFSVVTHHSSKPKNGLLSEEERSSAIDQLNKSGAFLDDWKLVRACVRSSVDTSSETHESRLDGGLGITSLPTEPYHDICGLTHASCVLFLSLWNELNRWMIEMPYKKHLNLQTFLNLGRSCHGWHCWPKRQVSYSLYYV
jgi:hypothetical protein